MAEAKYQNTSPKKVKLSGNSRKEIIYKIIVTIILVTLWQMYAVKQNNALIMPKASDVFTQFISCITDQEVIYNISLTMGRVLKGFGWAMIIGIFLGFIMGLSRFMNSMLAGFMDSVRQIPIMAWVPLTIVWFGIGDGPTIFLIAFSGVFPVILNTISGVRSISKDYYNAARSMGAGPVSIFKDVVVPGTIPYIMTGARVALSSGWMSVIWAEFIATSQGLGFLMVRSQTMMMTDRLIALMIFAALIGFIIDRGLYALNKYLVRWRREE